MRTVPLFAVFAVVVSGFGCSGTGGSCGSTCKGCCVAGVACETGDKITACGIGGAVCSICASGQQCIAGACEAPATAGGSGGGGGSGTAGGGTGVAGGFGGAGGGVAIDGGPGQSCFEDLDCPDIRFFFCNTTTALCEPSCRAMPDCTAAVRGPFALPECEGSLGCNCDEGRCVPALCAVDANCGAGKVCRDGTCVSPPAATAVASCEVVPSLVAARAGSSERFTVLATDTSGRPIVLSTGIAWSAVSSAFTLNGSGSGLSAVFDVAATTNATAPVAAVRATLGSVTCEAKALVFGEAVPAGALDVVVTDAATGRPVPGATVLMTGAAGMLGTGTTSSAGFVRLTGVTGTSVSVSAFHASFDWLTVAGYDVTGARALALPLHRSATSFGGRRGTVTGVPMSSNVHFGSSGLSFGHSFTELSRAALEGVPVRTHVKIGSAIDQDTDIGSGVFLAFAEQPLKPQTHAFGSAGVCRSGAAYDEVSIAAGTCSSRTSWAMTGDVPLGDLPIDALLGGVMNVNWGAVFARLTPVLRKLGSSVSRDVQFPLRPIPTAPDGGFDTSDVSQFTALDSPWSQVPFSQLQTLRVPDLPRFNGTFMVDAVLLGGPVVPERGFLPVAMGFGVNQSPMDDRLDAPLGLPTAGLVQLRAAPAHHGLEGLPYVAAIWARSSRNVPLPSTVATAGAVARLPGGPGFDPTGLQPLDFPAFTAMPEGGTWTQATRTFGLAGPTFTSESALLVTFKASNLTQWTVVVSPSAPFFTLPSPPGAFADRTAGAKLRIEALRLVPEQATAASVTWRALVEHGGVDLDDLLSSTVAFAVVDEP